MENTFNIAPKLDLVTLYVARTAFKLLYFHVSIPSQNQC